MKDIDYTKYNEKMVIQEYKKTFHLALFLEIIVIIFFLSFLVYSLVSLILYSTKNNNIDVSMIIAKVGDILTSFMAMSFFIVFLIFSSLRLNVKEDNIITYGYKNEKRIGFEAIAMFIAFTFFFAYGIASIFVLKNSFEISKLVIMIIVFLMCIPTFFVGIKTIKLSALLYNYGLLHFLKKESKIVDK